jgi:hypothetical protein
MMHLLIDFNNINKNNTISNISRSSGNTCDILYTVGMSEELNENRESLKLVIKGPEGQ